MADIINSIANNALKGLARLAGGQITGAIKDAADKTGVDFAYLMQQAKAESSFKADIQAKTSSATGLFQFIESTWMDMVDRYGPKHGIDTASASKDQLLALRNDPKLASTMAAELAGENKRVLDRNWGGEAGATELYFAHFLGAGSAAKFLSARDADGAVAAADLFPKAAAANKNVFYDRATGVAKSLDEVYAFFDKKFSIEGDDAPQSPVQLAEASPLSSRPEQSVVERSSYVVALQDPSASLRMTGTGLGITNSGLPSSYQSLIMNQMDLILLTQQLDLPLPGENSTRHPRGVS